MAKKNYYAVKVGIKPGIYETWNECLKQTKGHSGAIFKKFNSLKEAEEFIDNVSLSTDESVENIEIEKLIDQMNDDTLVAFVDGSYNQKSKVYGYGVVLINKDRSIEKIEGSDNNAEYVETQNIAGEIEGVQNAITHAVGKDYKKIIVFYDYTGIEQWVNGGWKANSSIAKDYVSFINSMKRCIEIEFKKVKAHSGIKYNEMADALAKKSLLKKGIKNSSDGCVTVTGIDIEDFEGIFEILEAESENTIRITKASSSKSHTNFILSLNNDKLVVSCYTRGLTNIQGKQSKLLEEFMRFVVELLPDKSEVVEILNDYYELEIEKDKIVERFNYLVPHFDKSKTNDQKLINTLHQAIYNTMLTGSRPNYTDLATPSLRAIEYYMYKIFISKDIIKVDSENHGFGYFEKIQGVFYLQEGHQKKFTPNELLYINELYNFYYNNRHTLDHWNKNGLTRMLETMEEARELIISNLELIDKYYTVF
ncbi:MULTISPECIES: ribonuclease H1 domain-containing protein [Priestia]|uniref:ribonuclease H1 domain-containing protein n=1 Tax=Priestia TaxID=2800373 RepID=UPI000C07D065|nr:MULTISPECIES: viroplasmin family protein [Priestia]MED3821648.1 viroplasmin family protein [Priestia aryabhattai]TPF14146.1 hypothetical protein CBE78_26810 [Priestia megaterium]TPF19519.1 hypothetical protein CBE79_26700 [Priestia megaterium]UPK52907.1 viroplasmin family protein [Bacillus sp. H8-1]